MLQVSGLGLALPSYLVVYAYYASGKIIKAMLTQGQELVTRALSDCVAYDPAPKSRGRVRRGRPSLYGKKVKLVNLCRSALKIDTLLSRVYDERNVRLLVRTSVHVVKETFFFHVIHVIAANVLRVHYPGYS